MQALNCGRHSQVSLIVVLALAVLGQSCGWQKTMRFPSPSGKAAIEIWQTRIDNSWGFRAELISPRGRTALFDRRRDTFVYFVHVYWSSDETKVGIVTRGFCRYEGAFDAVTNQQITFEQIRKDLTESIRTTYEVPQGVDPVNWADTSEAHTAFFRLHPEIQLTYR
jgi:hypothetical protein